MQQVRVQLGAMPPLLRTMVRDLIGSEAEMELVGGSGGGDILAAARRTGADVVVVHERSAGADVCIRTLLDRRPVSIVAIDEDGAAARLDIRWRHFGDLGRPGLVDALLSAVLPGGVQ